MENETKIGLIAFYLPQFHPIPENDKWWGKGFTDWTNVAKAKPRFNGHYQPHLPADLGFYDLRLPEIRQAQVELAKNYGIRGFCYYHYWFNGKRLLSRPIDEVLASKKPDFPFCFCWANEDWTRSWDGRSSEILIKQIYNEEDDRKHIHWLANSFSDHRYIRIKNKPLMLIYRANNIPDIERTITIWREEAWKLGIGEIYLCRVESFPDENSNPLKYGFDAAVEFQPDWPDIDHLSRKGIVWVLSNKLGLTNSGIGNNLIYEYSDVVDWMINRENPPYKRFPCVTPGWDNSPRRNEDAIILNNSSPEKYKEWLEKSIKRTRNFIPDEQIVFINAWNEWAEGNHLEPDEKFGHAFLEATYQALSGDP